MIATIRDTENRITAVCEYLRFQDGKLDDKGTDVFIGEMEVNPEHRNNGIFKKMIKAVYDKNQDFHRVVWFRQYKYPGSKPRVYTREQIIKHLGV